MTVVGEEMALNCGRDEIGNSSAALHVQKWCKAGIPSSGVLVYYNVAVLGVFGTDGTGAGTF